MMYLECDFSRTISIQRQTFDRFAFDWHDGDKVARLKMEKCDHRLF